MGNLLKQCRGYKNYNRLVFMDAPHTDIIPNEDDINKKKYNWQKDHQENQTGTQNSHKPTKIKKEKINKRYETWK